MNLSNYYEIKPHRTKRLIWRIVNITFFRIFPLSMFKGYRNFLLKLFGATIDKDALIYSSCIIYAPWNLSVGRACIGPKTEIYNKDLIIIGDDCVISQGSYLCTASHNITSLMLPLETSPIKIHNNAWIAADVFIGPGVTIGEGAVIGARAAVFKNVDSWTVVGGNPAKYIKDRIIKNSKKC